MPQSAGPGSTSPNVASRSNLLISMPDLVSLVQGREAEVFLRSDDSVLKLLRESTDAARAEHEAAALRSLNADGYSAPKFLDLVAVNGRRGIVTERIDGENLLVRLDRKSLSAGKWFGCGPTTRTDSRGAPQTGPIP
jgi:hypothetical protein